MGWAVWQSGSPHCPETFGLLSPATRERSSFSPRHWNLEILDHMCRLQPSREDRPWLFCEDLICPVATGGCTIRRPAPCQVPLAEAWSIKSPGHIRENTQKEGCCMRRAERVGRRGVGVEWTELESRSRARSSCSSSCSPSSPGFTHAAPSSSKRVHPPRRGTNRGLGKRITADHSTSLWGNAPRRNSPR